MSEGNVSAGPVPTTMLARSGRGRAARDQCRAQGQWAPRPEALVQVDHPALEGKRVTRLASGYLVTRVDGVQKHVHVLLAERALGKPLPEGAEVHHVDEDKSNCRPSNLVICPSAAYHKLLHQRQRAFDACGRYHWRLCHICKQYDDPANDMWVSRKKAHHRRCDTARNQQRRASHV